MNIKLYIYLIIFITQCQAKQMEYNKLTEFEEFVIINKGTEQAFTGKYNDHKEKGIYTCKQCGTKLFKSEHKFNSKCGWPSFDDEIEGTVKRVPDKDGRRTEIVCANCSGHLGHVFKGEEYTDKNLRHCVNSVSINFTPSIDKKKIDTAVFASGCFWGTEFYLKKLKGVISTSVGYIGGFKQNPTYKEVCSGTTGHAEAVEVIFDSKIVSYEEIAKLFFETHDPTQLNRQGPDIGEQYRSEIFYFNETQKKIAENLINILKKKGYNVVTKLSKASKFWIGEDYHQDYYDGRGKPYCHVYKKKFGI